MGHTVAMTGDGVNDVLALKDADCSIAMASGSDAAAQVAQLVLLESDFSKMPSVSCRRAQSRKQHRADGKPVSRKEYFLAAFVDLLDRTSGQLSAGAVADFADQYVYDRYPGVLYVTGAQYRPDQWPFSEQCAV